MIRMASGFIILQDRSCLAVRWTGYDALIRIVLRELGDSVGARELATILTAKIPPEGMDEGLEMGWGFMDEEQRDTIERSLDLRGLSEDHHQLYWADLQKDFGQLMRLGTDYAGLHPDIPHELLRKRKWSLRNGDPLAHSDWTQLADEHFERLSREGGDVG